MSTQRPKVSALVSKAHKTAVKIRQRAHSPYSKYKVGATVLTSSGKMFSGCNIENASYGGTVCAERVAIWKAVSEGETRFQDIVVVTEGEKLAPPCAFCLQVMAEFCGPETRIWVASPRHIERGYLMGELLPHPFDPSFLDG